MTKDGKKFGKPRLRKQPGVKSALSNVLIIFLCLILLLIGVGGIVATSYVTDVLVEISGTNYSGIETRINTYRSYFDRLKDSGSDVRETKPFIREGEKFYLWNVTPPGASEGELYRWKVNLQTNSVEPMTEAAARLDKSLGLGSGR